MYNWTFSSRQEHSPTWYMIAMVVVLSLVWYGITQWLYLMSIVAFLFAGVYILIENNSQPTTSVVVDDGWIMVWPTRYDYPSIESFSLISIGGVPTYLRLKLKKKVWPILDIRLMQDVNPTQLKEFLLGYIEEDTSATLSNSDAIIHAMRL